MDSVGAVGTSLRYARADHVHPTDTSRAPVNNPTFTGATTISGTLLMTGVASPAAIGSSTTNNWSPTGLGSNSVFRISATTPATITGLVAQAAGTELTFINVGGTNPITLSNLDAGSSAANQFNLGANTTLSAGQAITLIYDGTSSVWRPSGGSGGGGGAAVFVQDSAPATTVPPGSLWWQSSTGLLFLLYNDGTSIQWVYAGNTVPANNPTMYVAGGRFQYVSSTQCQLIPYKGDAIRIQGVIYSIPFGGVAITNTGLANNTLYYCYAFMSAGVMTLEFSTTGHVTDTAPGNVGTEIKSGDNSRSLVGMVYTAGGSNLFVNNANARTVRSWMNRKTEGINAAALGTNTAIGSSYGVFTGPMSFVAWLNENISIQCNLTALSATTPILTAVCWLDGAAVGSPGVINMDGSSRVLPAANPMAAVPIGSEGYHAAYGAMNINTGSATAYSACTASCTLSE
jgi:hypothetical protein